MRVAPVRPEPKLFATLYTYKNISNYGPQGL
jgi:hypothetical protein